jgi:hypothetical protein
LAPKKRRISSYLPGSPTTHSPANPAPAPGLGETEVSGHAATSRAGLGQR